MKNFYKILLFPVFLVLGCTDQEPKSGISEADTAELVERVAENIIDGLPGLLIDPDGVWLGDKGFVQGHGDPLPPAILNKKVSFKAVASPDLRGIEVIRAVLRGLGLNWGVDSGTFYLGGEVSGSAFGALGSSNSPEFDPNFGGSILPPIELAEQGLGGVPSAPGAASEVRTSGGGNLGDCDGTPVRISLPNEGLEELERFGTAVEVSQALSQNSVVSAGEVALVSLYNRGLNRDLDISGTTEDALNQLVAALGLGTWEYRDNYPHQGKIIFKYYVTRTFSAPLLPVSERDESGSRDRLWTRLRTGLARNLGSSGEISTWCDLGEIEVTAKPDAMDPISDWIDAFGNKASRSVHIEMDVYEIDNSADDGFTLDWAGLSLKGLAGDVPFISVFDADGLVDNITSEDIVGGRLDLDSLAALPSSPAGGFSIVAEGKGVAASFVGDLLARSGNSTLAYSTATGVPVGQVVRLNFTLNTTANIGSSTSFTDSGEEAGDADVLRDYTTGFMMDMEAKILRGDNILISYGLDVSTSEPGGPEDVIQFQTTQSTVRNQVIMKAGTEVVQTAYQFSTLENEKSGVGDSSFWLLGGSDTQSETLTTFVIVIRASIVRPVF